MARVTGVDRSTIYRGRKDIDETPGFVCNVRRKGGGAKPLSVKDKTLVDDLLTLLEPATHGDPMRPLRRTSKSPAKSAVALCDAGHEVSGSSVRRLIKRLGFRRQSNSKTLEGGSNLDRNAQFEQISDTAIEFTNAGQPVISVDTKKKELTEQFKNPGSDYLPTGKPNPVKVHDFMDKDLGKIAPYGNYDI